MGAKTLHFYSKENTQLGSHTIKDLRAFLFFSIQIEAADFCKFSFLSNKMPLKCSFSKMELSSRLGSYSKTSWILNVGNTI